MERKLIFATHRLSKNGGAPRYVYELAKRAKKDFKVTILTLDSDKNLDLKGIEIIKLKNPKLPSVFGHIQGTLRISKKCRELKSEYGKNCLIHSQGNTSLYSDIVTCQGCYKSWGRYQIKNEKNVLRKIIKMMDLNIFIPNFIERQVYKNSKKIISISDLTKNDIIEMYKLNSYRIYSGVDIDEFSLNKKTALRKKLSIKNNEKMILFIGHYFERKGLEESIRAIKYITFPVKLIVVGKDKIEKYEKIVNDLGLQNKVIFYGKSDNIKEFYKNSDIFLFPTKFEPFGLVTLEACACGLPVITTDKNVNGFAELLTHKKDSLLLKKYPVNPEEIAENINFLIKNKGIYNKIRKNARMLAEKNSWDKVYSEIRKVYESFYRSLQI